MKELFIELYYFTLKNAGAAIFAGYLLLLIILTNFVSFNLISTYDFIFLSAILFQIVVLLLKVESPKEFLVIIVFHFLATGMELFKTHPNISSWSYPQIDNSFFVFYTVPLFTGFLYSAVGSYISRAFRFLELYYEKFPKTYHLWILSFLIYLNFFTHHFIFDIRYLLFIYILIVFFKTNVKFKVYKKLRKIYFLLSAFLTALFLWIAENIGSYSNIWLYPDQVESWKMVSLSKMGSWFLLLVLSFSLVSIIYKNRFSK